MMGGKRGGGKKEDEPKVRKVKPEPVMKVDLFEDDADRDQQLARRDNGHEDNGEFQEPDVSSRRESTYLDELTANQLLGLMYQPDNRTLKMVAVTSPNRFIPSAIGGAFNRIVKGEHRDGKTTVFDILMEEIDLRSPSLRGDSRKELVKINEAKQRGLVREHSNERERWG